MMRYLKVVGMLFLFSISINAQEGQLEVNERFANTLLRSLITGRIDQFRLLSAYSDNALRENIGEMDEANRRIRSSEIDEDFMWILRNLPPEDRRSFKVVSVKEIAPERKGHKMLRIVVTYGFDYEARFAITTGHLKVTPDGNLKMLERFRRPIELVRK